MDADEIRPELIIKNLNGAHCGRLFSLAFMGVTKKRAISIALMRLCLHWFVGLRIDFKKFLVAEN